MDIPRTGSTSLRAELGQSFGRVHGKLDVEEPGFARKSLIPHHQSAKQIRDLVGERNWNALFTFSFVRNPWARALSFHHFIHKRYPKVARWSLNEYLEHLMMVRVGGVSDYEIFRYPPFTMSALEFLVDDKGDLLVEEVYKFEDRAEAIEVIADRVGLRKVSHIHFEAATPSDLHYAHAFDDAAKRLVEHMFGDEIERFGYRFGDT